MNDPRTPWAVSDSFGDGMRPRIVDSNGEQIAIVLGMPQGIERAALITESVNERARLRELLESFVSAWDSGDGEWMADIAESARTALNLAAEG